MSKSIIVLVEDDVSLGATLSERLEKSGFQVKWARSIAQTSEVLKNIDPDLFILDVGLPDGSGFDLAKKLQLKNSAPIIFLTAQASAEDRLTGFEAGAEEYIPKPFHLKELMMRIQHVLDNHVKVKKLGEIFLDRKARAIVTNKGSKEVLNSKEYDLLTLLIDASPRVVSRDEILDSVWGKDNFPTNRTVDNIVVRLRSVLEKQGHWIKSVRGIGYQWFPESDRG